MADDDLIYVGTYSEPIPMANGRVLPGNGEGIHILRLERATGRLHPVAIARGVRNPSYLAIDRARAVLYCVNELKTFEGADSGAVSAFRIDAAGGAPTPLGTPRASGGADPCHVRIDRDGRHVLVANYTGGSVAVLPIGADGALQPACAIVRHAGSGADPRRQAGPHAHAVEIDPAGRFALVAELGLDRLMIYAFDAHSGQLTPNARQPWIAAAPGAGPRQVALHPGGRFAYAINELDSTLSAYGYDAATGALGALQTVSTLPAGCTTPNTCAELQIHPGGAFLYGSNRGHDSIAVFAIDPGTGLLSARGHVSTGGRIPRGFGLSADGRFLVAANQDSDSVVSFAIDPATGMPTPTGHAIAVGTPVCVRFA